MIKIDKAPIGEVPADFIRLGNRRIKIDCELFDSCPAECLSGVQPFHTVKEYIYRNPDVKKKLNESHNFKCCYCEAKFKLGSLDVEHYRPKRLISRPEGDIHLGYFWLAYDWGNLLLSCAECNRTYKGSLFPLENEAMRASSTIRNIDNERPLLINPSSENPLENPREHIIFVNESPKAKANSRRGKKTIEVLNLRRLFEDRLEHIDKLKSALEDIEMWKAFEEHLSELPPNIAEMPRTKKLLKHHQKEAMKAILLLDNATKKDAEFSSMAQDFLANQSFSKP